MSGTTQSKDRAARRTARGAAAGMLGLAALMLAACTGMPADTVLIGSQALIDGPHGLTNWTTLGPANWHPTADAIEADQPNNGTSGYLVSTRVYANFRLHAEFWVSENGKSGIFFRCDNQTQINSKTCYETQIFPHRVDQYGTGALVNVAAVTDRYLVAGQWNSYDITAEGDHLIVALNGKKTVDVMHHGLRDGRIVLQFRGGVVRYRRLTIQPG